MILSTLENSDRIESLHPGFKVLFDYIRNNNLLAQDTGRIEIDGDSIFINNVHPQMVPAENQLLESHRIYLDVHIPLDAVEVIGWKPTAECVQVKSAYSADDECELYTDKPTNYITVKPGEFLIVYPEDAHAPLIGEGKIRKLIAKIRI